MLYTGPAFSAAALGDGVVELKFDLAGESVNKLSQVALRDFAAATQAIAKDGTVKGVVVTDSFGRTFWVDGAGRGDDDWQRWSMFVPSRRDAGGAVELRLRAPASGAQWRAQPSRDR